jgi:hypothetical protein
MGVEQPRNSKLACPGGLKYSKLQRGTTGELSAERSLQAALCESRACLTELFVRNLWLT